MDLKGQRVIGGSTLTFGGSLAVLGVQKQEIRLHVQMNQRSSLESAKAIAQE